MRDSKGISMVSLIVTIVCIILLSSIAIGTGTKYIRETKANNKETFIAIMSSAVARRHEDTNLNSVSYPYLGYYINNGVVFDEIFAPKVPEDILFENATWYVVDTTTARELGVKEPERYIETFDPNYTEDIKVALVDYETARVFLIDTNAYEFSKIDSDSSSPILGHTHRYVDGNLYPNCTEPKKCADCGFIEAEPLGHQYDSIATPELATGDEENAHYNKVCTRCGMQGGYERHIFEYNHMVKNNKWYHKATCIVCGYSKRNVDGTDREELCTQLVKLPESEDEKLSKHIRLCTVCLHEENEEHNVTYRNISESMHEKYCDNPLCEFLISREYHVDEELPEEKCDLCGANIISYDYPQIIIAEMQKTNPTPTTTEEKYIAKYGDTLTLRIVAEKPITNLEVHIGGHLVSNGLATMTSTNSDKEWLITYNISTARTIPNGDITFKIDCESKAANVPLPSVVTNSTDGKKVLFDGTMPTVEYIPKEERLDEVIQN